MRILPGFCLILTVTTARLSAQGMAFPPDQILVIVDDVIITEQEVRNSIEPSVELLLRQYGEQPALLNQKVLQLQREKVDDLVAKQLILKDFTNAGYNLPESFLEDRVQEHIRRDYQGDRRYLRKTLQEEGKSFEKYRKDLKERIIVDFLRDKHVSQELIISPQKIEDYYRTNLAEFKVEDQVKLRMIAIPRTKDAPDAAKKMAQEVLKKLESGVPFDEMAAVYSEGSQRFTTGDWAEAKGLREEIAKVVFGLKSGQHSGVIETPDACYVALVEERRTAHTKPLPEARDEIERNLLLREKDRLYKKWIERLKSKAFVRYF